MTEPEMSISSTSSSTNENPKKIKHLEEALKKAEEEVKALKDAKLAAIDYVVKNVAEDKVKSRIVDTLNGGEKEVRTTTAIGNLGEDYVMAVLKDLGGSVEFEHTAGKNYQGDIKASFKGNSDRVMFEVKNYGTGVRATNPDRDKFFEDLTRSGQDCVAGVLINLNGPATGSNKLSSSSPFDIKIMDDKVYVLVGHFRDKRYEDQKACLSVLLDFLPMASRFVDKDANKVIMRNVQQMDEYLGSLAKQVKKIKQEHQANQKGINELNVRINQVRQNLTGNRESGDDVRVGESTPRKKPANSYKALPKGQRTMPHYMNAPKKSDQPADITAVNLEDKEKVKRNLKLEDEGGDDDDDGEEESSREVEDIGA